MSKEIKQKIDDLCMQLEEAVTPGIFTLNLETERISKKIAALQEQCKHNFVNGQCEFCYCLEVNNE